MSPLDSLRPGMNPREHLRRHRERGPKRYTFTVRDVAEAADCSVPTVRRHMSTGELKINRLWSVVDFVSAQRAKRAGRTA